MTRLDDILGALHPGNCATFARDVLASMFGKTLRLEQFALPLDALSDADTLLRDIARDAAVLVVVPLPGDVMLMRRPDGRAHIGVVINVEPLTVLHLADTSGRAHATKASNLARFGLVIEGIYRVMP